MNSGEDEVNLENVEFLANGETIDNPEFEDQYLQSEAQTTVETNLEASETTEFAIEVDETQITSYNCDYIEEALTC